MIDFFDPTGAPGPREIGLLLLPEFSNLTLAALVEPLRAANRLSGRELYRCRLLSPDGVSVASSSGIEVAAAGALAGAGRPFAVLVLASYRVEHYVGRALLADLRHLRGRGMVLGGLESGAYVLARGGLLDGYRATTHWEDLDDFAARFPRVRAVRDRYVVDRDRVTTGGAIPTLDLALNLVRRQHGLALAMEVASTFIYEQDAPSHDPQHVVSLGRLRWMDPALAAAVELMENHLDEPLPVADIARRAGVGERALQRRFRRHVGTSPVRYYAYLRLGAARRLLTGTDLSVAEIADACGFRSRTAFARAFRAWAGVSPSGVRGRLP